MKVSINFDGLTAVEARALINFITDKGPTNEPVEPPKEPRRRKSAVAGDKDKPAEDSKNVVPDGGDNDSVARVSDGAKAVEKPRRQRKPKDTEDKPAPTPRKRRRSVSQAQAEPEAPVESADELSDADVAKAASEAATSLGVDVVKELLVKAGVDNVSQLSQPARQEFLVNLDFQKKFLGGSKADWDDEIPF